MNYLFHCSNLKMESDIDWNKCIVCQEVKSEYLQCPAENTNSKNLGFGYKSFVDNIKSFQDIGCVVPHISNILNRSCLEQTLLENHAKWHKICRNKFNDLKLQRELKKRNSSENNTKETPSKVTRLNTGAAASTIQEVCFFCNNSGQEKLHKVCTFNIQNQITKCAIDLEDNLLLAKLSAGDLIAQEAVYHKKCYTDLRNRVRDLETKDVDTDFKIAKGVALAELISSIEEEAEINQASVFILADLAKVYVKRIEQLCGQKEGRINTTYLKNKILLNIPYLREYKDGRNVYLAYDETVSTMLKESNNFDNDFIVLSKAATIIRNDMFKTKSKFTGTFEQDCQQKSTSKTLQSFISMVLDGSNIHNNIENIIDKHNALTIAQLIFFNSTIRRRGTSMSTFHCSAREPPLPLYIGLLVHAETRKMGLIDKLCDLGISVSYNRVLEVSSGLGNSACQRFQEENLVCPPKLRFSLFTTGAVDNIDHNPSSNTSIGYLHGTTISVFQHPTSENRGQGRNISLIDDKNKSSSTTPLPEEYTTIPPVLTYNERPDLPHKDIATTTNGDVINDAMGLEKKVNICPCTFKIIINAIEWLDRYTCNFNLYMYALLKSIAL